MHAYALIGKYKEKFRTTEMVDTIKGEHITDFTQLWKGSNVLNIQAGKALYLYGGRKALIKALAQVKGKSIEAGSFMTLYRAQRRVGTGISKKTKQLLMLTMVPKDDDEADRLMQSIVPEAGFSTYFPVNTLTQTIEKLQIIKQ